MSIENVLQCTGRYTSLVRNGIGGTLDRPCANAWDLQLYCNSPDVDAWLATAATLKARLRTEWNNTAAKFPIPAAVYDYVDAVEKEYCQSDEYGVCTKKWLPESSWFNTTWNATSAATIAKWCTRAACALEILDNVRGLAGPVEAAPENAAPVLDENVSKAIGKIGEGFGEAVGGLGKGLGEGIGGLGQGLGEGAAGLGQGVGEGAAGLGKGAGDGIKGVGEGLSWLPVGLGIAGAGAVVVGVIYLTRMPRAGTIAHL